MTTYALILFVIAALGGLVMAMKVLKGQFAPWPLSFLHAALGAAGLGFLLIAILKGSSDVRVLAALGILVVAALGGFYLAALHAKKSIAPKAVVLIHATVAAIGVVTLITTLL